MVGDLAVGRGVSAGVGGDADGFRVGADDAVPAAADFDQVAGVDGAAAVVGGFSGGDLVGADLAPVGELVVDLGELVGELLTAAAGGRGGGVTDGLAGDGVPVAGVGVSVEVALQCPGVGFECVDAVDVRWLLLV